jgi:tetratricopeptide (TPR) repeat protein
MLAIIAATSSIAGGQDSAGVATVATDVPVPVFVLPFKQRSQGNGTTYPYSSTDVSRLVHDLLTLQLIASPRVAVQDQVRPPLCGPKGSTSALLGADQPPGWELGVGSPRADVFYVIDGSVDVSPDGALMNYSVVRCDGSGTTTLATETAPLLWRTAFTDVVETVQAIDQRLMADRPRIGVDIATLRILPAGSSASRQQIAFRLGQAIAGAVWSSRELAVSPSGRYHVSGTVDFTRTPRIVTHLTVRDADNGSTISVPALASSTDSLPHLSEAAADRVLNAIERLRGSDRVGLFARNTDWSVLKPKIEELLCKHTIAQCVPDPTSAAALAAQATRADTTNWQAVSLLAFAANQEGDLPRTIAAYLRCVRLLDARRVSPAPKVSDRTDVHNALGRAYLAVGNYSDAATHFDRSLSLDPLQSSTRISLARALRSDHRNLDALTSLSAATATTVARDSTFIPEISAVLDVLTPLEIASGQVTVLRTCQLADSLRSQCAHVVRRAADVLSATGRIEKSLTAYRMLLRLTSSNSDRLWGHGVLSVSFLGTQRFLVGSDGILQPSYPGFQADSVSAHLDSADAYRSDSTPSFIVAWLARLRSAYWRNNGQMRTAIVFIDSALSLAPAPGTQLLRAQFTFLQALDAQRQAARDSGASRASARDSLFAVAASQLSPLVLDHFEPSYYYWRVANHALGLDDSTKRTFDAIAKQDSTRTEALTQLTSLCLDQMRDSECAFGTSERLLALRAASRNDSLAAIEGALLTNRYDSSAAWIRPFAQTVDSLEPCLRAVTLFYVVFTDIGSRHTRAIRGDYEAWQRANQAFHATGAGRCWIFEGDKRAIATAPLGEAFQKLLLDMIRAFETGASPPTLPDNAAANAGTF